MLLAAGAASSSTSVPTWLAVLAIVAPVLTGWVGALLAWLAATRTAERNAALTRQDEQRRWNRERREKAYVTLLERRNELVETRSGWFITFAKEPAGHAGAAEESLREALALVELAGTARAVELARTWVHVLVERRVKGEEELFGDLVERENEWRDQFVALIREELGVDD